MERIREVLGGVVETQRQFMIICGDLRSGLARIESGQHHAQALTLQLLTLSTEISMRLDNVEDGMQAPASHGPIPARLQLLDKVLEVLPKIASNWAPISAGLVAAWKWGVPYLRQLLG